MQAYRKLAVQYHPDKYDGDDKAHAEKMFLDIAAAKEVLTDPGEFAKVWCAPCQDQQCNIISLYVFYPITEIGIFSEYVHLKAKHSMM